MNHKGSIWKKTCNVIDDGDEEDDKFKEFI